MALGLDGDALDRSRYARSSQRLPTTEGSQATSNTTCRPRSAPEQKLNPRRHCSPSQRRVMSILAATASQCSTKRRDILASYPPRNNKHGRTAGRCRKRGEQNELLGLADEHVPARTTLTEMGGRSHFAAQIAVAPGGAWLQRSVRTPRLSFPILHQSELTM